MFSESIPTPAVEDDKCVCASCGEHMRRLGRKGFLQTTVFPVFGFYPWECLSCRSKKLVRARGTKAFHRIWDDSWIEFAGSAGRSEIAPSDANAPAEAPTYEAYSSPETEHSQAAPLADA